MKAQNLAYLGRFDEALRTAKRCTELAPTATACINERIWIHRHRGDCAAMEADARRWQAVASGDPDPYTYLANAAVSRRAPPEEGSSSSTSPTAGSTP